MKKILIIGGAADLLLNNEILSLAIINIAILEDTDDIEYTKAVIDRKLKAICGENFQHWEERYKHD